MVGRGKGRGMAKRRGGGGQWSGGQLRRPGESLQDFEESGRIPAGLLEDKEWIVGGVGRWI